MKVFIKKIALISLPVLGFILLTFWQADGKTDPFYLRFTSDRQQSLILGTSRAAQGLQPALIDSVLGEKGLFNFAMTVANTPYGPVYFDAMKKKLDPAVRGGIFILEISPWSICSSSENPNDIEDFREANLFLSKLHFFNLNPNVEYLSRFYSKAFVNLWSEDQNSMMLHSDGWLEVDIRMDSLAVSKRTQIKLKNYRETQLPKYQFSKVRYDYFLRTINFLKEYGEVFLIRIPIDSEMLILEDKLMPDFNARIDSIARDKGIQYFNYTNHDQEYIFTDGNHLWKESGREFSKKLGEDILRFQKGKR